MLFFLYQYWYLNLNVVENSLKRIVEPPLVFTFDNPVARCSQVANDAWSSSSTSSAQTSSSTPYWSPSITAWASVSGNVSAHSAHLCCTSGRELSSLTTVLPVGCQWCQQCLLRFFTQVSDIVSTSAPRQGPLPSVQLTSSVIQAAPTVYSAPPTPHGYKRVDVRAQRQARMVFFF